MTKITIEIVAVKLYLNISKKWEQQNGIIIKQ